MKAEEILATYCTGSMFILERQDVVVGILQDNGVKKKDAEKAYSIFKQNHPFGYSGDDVPPVDIDMFFRAGMRYLDAADDLVSFKKAYWTLFVAAVRGHPEALFRLGMLMGGEYEGCPFTEVKSAVKFFRKADEKGHPDAKLHLALLIADGFRPDTAEGAMALRGAGGVWGGEPFASLDFITRGELQAELLDIQKELQKTILLVTHQLDEALLLAQKIVVLHADSSVRVWELELPYPRDLTSPQLTALREEITAECRKD